jgi:excisionase family DNA binding protein
LALRLPKLHVDRIYGKRASTDFSSKEEFMSVPAKQTRDVNFMCDDPERLLDVNEAAALLHVKTKTLYAWVSRNKIPYRKVCSLVRFHRGELIEWAKGQQQSASKTTPTRLAVVE